MAITSLATIGKTERVVEWASQLKAHLKFRELTELKLDCDMSESVFIEIKGNRHNMVIGSIYQPPNTCVHSFLTSYK